MDDHLGCARGLFNGFLKSIALFAYSANAGSAAGCVLLYLLKEKIIPARGVKVSINAMHAAVSDFGLSVVLRFAKIGSTDVGGYSGLIALTIYHGAYFVRFSAVNACDAGGVYRSRIGTRLPPSCDFRVFYCRMW